MANGYKKRFLVVEGSETGHCCFEASVVDTTKPMMIGDKHYNNRYEAVCECMYHSDAARIEAALNNE